MCLPYFSFVMATANYNWNLSRTSIIEAALKKVGALGPGQAITAEQSKDAIRSLNSILKEWQAEHGFQYALKTGEITLVDGDSDYTLPSDPRIILLEQAYYRDASSRDDELIIESYRTFQKIPDKTSTSNRPTHVALQFGATNTLHCWPVPNSAVTGKIFYLGIAAIKDMDSNSDVLDFQERFARAAIYALAADLADDYGLALSERQWFERKAMEGLKRIKRSDYDRPDEDMVKGAY